MKCLKYKKELLLAGDAAGWGKEESFIQWQRGKGACGSEAEPLRQLSSPSLRSQQQPQRGSGATLGRQPVLPGKRKVLKSHTAAVAVALRSCNHLGLAPRRTPRRGQACHPCAQGRQQSPQTLSRRVAGPSPSERPQAGYIGTSERSANSCHWAALGFISNFITWCF